MAAQVIGEQRPAPVSVSGPFLFTGSLSASTSTQILVPGNNTKPWMMPMPAAGQVLALSAFGGQGFTSGAITLQLAYTPAGTSPTAAPQALAGATLVLPAAGGANYVLLSGQNIRFNAQDSLTLLLNTPTAGTALLTCHVFVGY